MFWKELAKFKNSPDFALYEKNNRENPATSWVIRTYNEEKWLGTVLAGLFIQERLDFEVIIVDSGSTDKTLQIVKRFPVRKLIQIKKKHFTYPSALNLGIKQARGKYIGIISGHSVPVSKTWYENGVKHFEDNSVAGVTGHYYSLPDGSVSEKLGDMPLNPANKKVQHYYSGFSNTNSMIRKDLWQVYPFDETLQECEDYDWASEMLSRGFDIVKDPAFNVYHSHGGLGRAVYIQRLAKWKRICAAINRNHPERKIPR